MLNNIMLKYIHCYGELGLAPPLQYTCKTHMRAPKKVCSGRYVVEECMCAHVKYGFDRVAIL
jgi:hypothetical protein